VTFKRDSLTGPRPGEGGGGLCTGVGEQVEQPLDPSDGQGDDPVFGRLLPRLGGMGGQNLGIAAGRDGDRRKP
jgi:hypothetical protein